MRGKCGVAAQNRQVFDGQTQGMIRAAGSVQPSSNCCPGELTVRILSIRRVSFRNMVCTSSYAVALRVIEYGYVFAC